MADLKRMLAERSPLYGQADATVDTSGIDVHSALRAMEQGLGDKPFCVGIHMSLADIAVVVALGYLDFRFPEIDWRADHPNLATLQAKLAERASFAATRPPQP